MAHERICVVDNKPYRYCGRCGKYEPRNGGEMFCSDNCRDIFSVCSKYVTKKITATEAKELLDKLDLSNIEHFQKALKADVANILLEATSVEPEVVEEVNAEEIKIEDAAEEENVYTTAEHRQKKHKKHRRDNELVNVD